MKAWLDLLRQVRLTGSVRSDRTGVGTQVLFGMSIRVDNTTSAFPAVTTKALAFRVCAAEMACFLQGERSLEAFRKAGCSIWDGNGLDERWVSKAGKSGDSGPQFEGDLGRIYGVQWRQWQSVRTGLDGNPERHFTDQLKQLLHGLATDPNGRRHLVTCWNPGEMDQMCLPPCPVLFQVFKLGRKLDMAVYQRSCDLFLGLPFDIAGYALLQRLIALELGLQTNSLTFFIGDAHIYRNHFDQVDTVLQSVPRKPPVLELRDGASLWNLKASDVRLLDYDPCGIVKAPLNV